jgi:hypothetical protein
VKTITRSYGAPEVALTPDGLVLGDLFSGTFEIGPQDADYESVEFGYVATYTRSGQMVQVKKLVGADTGGTTMLPQVSGIAAVGDHVYVTGYVSEHIVPDGLDPATVIHLAEANWHGYLARVSLADLSLEWVRHFETLGRPALAVTDDEVIHVAHDSRWFWECGSVQVNPWPGDQVVVRRFDSGGAPAEIFFAGYSGNSRPFTIASIGSSVVVAGAFTEPVDFGTGELPRRAADDTGFFVRLDP